MKVHVGLLTVVLELPATNTLKEKRRIVKSLLERLRREMRVSAAETGFQNRLRTCELALAFVGIDRGTMERARARAEERLSHDPRAEPVEITWAWL